MLQNITLIFLCLFLGIFSVSPSSDFKDKDIRQVTVTQNLDIKDIEHVLLEKKGSSTICILLEDRKDIDKISQLFPFLRENFDEVILNDGLFSIEYFKEVDNISSITVCRGNKKNTEKIDCKYDFSPVLTFWQNERIININCSHLIDLLTDNLPVVFYNNKNLLRLNLGLSDDAPYLYDKLKIKILESSDEPLFFIEDEHSSYFDKLKKSLELSKTLKFLSLTDIWYPHFDRTENAVVNYKEKLITAVKASKNLRIVQRCRPLAKDGFWKDETDFPLCDMSTFIKEYKALCLLKYARAIVLYNEEFKKSLNNISIATILSYLIPKKLDLRFFSDKKYFYGEEFLSEQRLIPSDLSFPQICAIINYSRDKLTLGSSINVYLDYVNNA